jgi:tRNA 2-thiouridine synthesizing protein C
MPVPSVIALSHLVARIVKKKILIVCRTAPYGSSLAREAIDTALAAAVFEQALSVLFMDDGVYQLTTEQHSTELGQKNHQKLLDSLAMYDIEELFADNYSLKKRRLTQLELRAGLTRLDKSEVSQFIESHNLILSY